MKPSTVLAIASLAALASCVQGKPQPQSAVQDDYLNDDEYYDDGLDYGGDEAYDDRGEEEEITVDPNFTSNAETITVDKGTTISLPCYVDEFPKNYVIMWKKVTSDQPKFLAVGKTIMGSKDRMSVQLNHKGDKRGSTLTIRLAVDEDAGQYICQLGSTGQKELKHTVEIRQPPEISKTPKSGHVLAKKGDTVSMKCIGKGDPLPEVSWTRVGKRMPDGSNVMKGDELNFINVNHRHSGIYTCTADNGFGEPVKEKIEVSVEFEPEVEVEEVFIHATQGNAIELVCVVNANPKPIVKWFKNTMELTDENARLNNHGHRHTLMIPSVTEEDLGNYTCRAENKHGLTSRELEVSGKAGFADFTSSARGGEPASYLLEWQSESRTRITSFELRHRARGEHSWKTAHIEPIPTTNFIYAGKQQITGLAEATQYEATVAAKNQEGWSRHSKVFHFATFGAEPLRDVNSATNFRSHQSILSALSVACAVIAYAHLPALGLRMGL